MNTKYISLVLFGVLFGAGLWIAHAMVWMYADDAIPARLPRRSESVPRGLRSDVNAASLTTAARRESTLHNPVGMLAGQPVFRTVRTNPPR